METLSVDELGFFFSGDSESERLRDRFSGSGDEDLDLDRRRWSRRLSQRLPDRSSCLLGILREEEEVRFIRFRYT